MVAWFPELHSGLLRAQNGRKKLRDWELPIQKVIASIQFYNVELSLELCTNLKYILKMWSDYLTYWLGLSSSVLGLKYYEKLKFLPALLQDRFSVLKWHFSLENQFKKPIVCIQKFLVFTQNKQGQSKLIFYVIGSHL